MTRKSKIIEGLKSAVRHARGDETQGTVHHVMICANCGRSSGRPACRNTRDMDPVDGGNSDPICHAALHKAGGGERGHLALDEMTPQQLKDLALGLLGLLEARGERIAVLEAMRDAARKPMTADEIAEQRASYVRSMTDRDTL